MDVLQFVDSRAIAQHWKEIGFEPSPLEAAWLIWQSGSATQEEKHRAWRELIDTTPDTPVEWEHWSAPEKSLHRFLEAYMDMENGWLEEVQHPKGFVRYCGDDGHYQTLRELLQKDSCTVDGSAYMEYLWEDRGIRFDVKNGAVKNAAILQWGDFSMAKDECTLYEDCFQALWFAFPVPFQKGDVVWAPRLGKSDKDWFDGTQPFVLEETCVEVSQRLGRPLHDVTDMTAYGYFQNHLGGLYHECMHNYLSLDYVSPKELTGKSRVLTALSSFLKGEIDVSLFARAYHQILLEEYARAVHPLGITPEGLRLAGLEETL